jgi:hypothetical protein
MRCLASTGGLKKHVYGKEGSLIPGSNGDGRRDIRVGEVGVSKI